MEFYQGTYAQQALSDEARKSWEGRGITETETTIILFFFSYFRPHLKFLINCLILSIPYISLPPLLLPNQILLY